MCGIVGGAGRLHKAQEDMVLHLLMLDTIRGPHSTGLLSVAKNNGQANVLKALGTPWDLVRTHQWDKFITRPHKVLLGHNRWATKGKITARNAHPFTHGHISGVHNGTLRNQALLSNAKNFEVDSDNIFHDIREHGAEATVAKLDGAYCLSWWDAKQQTLNFIRNGERPLFMTKSKDGGCLFWASEEWMLKIAASKARVEIDEPYALLINTLTIFDVTDKGIMPHEETGKNLVGYQRPLYISPIGGGESAKAAYSSVKDIVEFEVIGEKSSGYSASGYAYTIGEVVSGPHKGKDVRIFCYTGFEEMRKTLKESKGFFTGEVNYEFKERVDLTQKWVQVLQIPASTIKPLPLDIKALDVDLPELVNSKKYAYPLFLKKTSIGCYWCGHKPMYVEWPSLHWNKEEKEFLCKDCNIPEYHEYFDAEDVDDRRVG